MQQYQQSKSPFIVNASASASASAAAASASPALVRPTMYSHANPASKPAYQTVTLKAAPAMRAPYMKAKPAARTPYNLNPMDTAVLDQTTVDAAVEAQTVYAARVQPPIVQLQTMNASHVIVDLGGHMSSVGSWVQHLHTHTMQQSDCITKLKAANVALHNLVTALQTESKQREADTQKSMNELKSMVMQLDARLSATATKLSATLYSVDKFTVDTDAKTEPAGLMDDILMGGNKLNRATTDLIASGRESAIPSPSAGLSDVSRQLLLSHAASQGQLSNAFINSLSQPLLPQSPIMFS